MGKPGRIIFLFIIILLEGYVVLATEMLAIRQTIPYVGTGTDTVSIIIAAVLMPLAAGYHAGGRFQPYIEGGRRVGIRDKLIFNIMVSLAILLVGLSYILISQFFIMLINFGITNRLLMTTLYALIFLVTPVYLLGQTIPLISNYFSKQRLAEITGRMLFFSTLGSFFGAVFTTLVLMALIGVHNTAGVLFVTLALLVVLLSRRKLSETVAYAIAMAAIGLALNSDYTMRMFDIVENNQYNTVVVFTDEDGGRHMALNNNDSSMYRDDGRKHAYIEFAEKVTIETLSPAAPAKDILVVGAGAFTYGLEDTKNNYDYIDIDESLKEIAEEKILRRKLNPNVTFHPLEIRAFLMETAKTYDVIFLDAYQGDLTLPEHLVTQDFYRQVRDHLKPGGIMIANFIAAPDFSSEFSRNLDRTLRSVFPYISRHVMDDNYMLWNINENAIYNIFYLYKDHPEAGPGAIYTDNKNRVFYDKPKSR